MTGITREEIERILASDPFPNDHGSLPWHDLQAVVWHISNRQLRALLEHALTEQSRIDAAVAKERERCAGIAGSFARRNREWAATARAGGADQLTALFSHSANAADEERSRILSPTPTTEEGA